jgi:ribosome recycling factor
MKNLLVEKSNLDMTANSMPQDVNTPMTAFTIKQREDLSKFKMGCLEIDRQLLAKK